LLVGEDEAPNIVLHYRCAFRWTSSNVRVAGDGKPPFGTDSSQPYRVVSTGEEDVVLENDIFTHLLEFVGYGAG
jgi:hypothetical protein